DLGVEEVFVVGQNENVVEEVVDDAQVSTATTTVTITTKEITLAQALESLKTSKPKVKGIVILEPGKSTLTTPTTTTTTTISSQQPHDKGKRIMIEEPVKPKKKDVQIRLDEEAAKKLQAESDEEERLAREKAEKEQEANIALIETWDHIQAKIDADHQLAERLKHFAPKRAEEKRNKPPTKAQQRKIMCNYLKNKEGYKLKDLKLKEFDSIQEMFDKAFRRVNTFEDFRAELVKGEEKRAGEDLIQESTKKQKVEDDKETTELKQFMETIPDEEEIAINAIPLAMLKSFDKEDLEDLYKLVKAKYEKSTRLVEDLDFLLWGNLKTMFKPHVEDEVWRNQQGYKVLEWKLYDSYGVHSLMMQHMHIYMLVEKKDPLVPLTLSMMLEKNLQIDYESKMAYQLYKLIMKQLKK
ncbi:hypothetical protein Tco_1290037, partial [Tanacetum coccineum]